MPVKFISVLWPGNFRIFQVGRQRGWERATFANDGRLFKKSWNFLFLSTICKSGGNLLHLELINHSHLDAFWGHSTFWNTKTVKVKHLAAWSLILVERDWRFWIWATCNSLTFPITWKQTAHVSKHLQTMKDLRMDVCNIMCHIFSLALAAEASKVNGSGARFGSVFFSSCKIVSRKIHSLSSTFKYRPAINLIVCLQHFKRSQ